MTRISPWSVKGVEPEAREAAKIAARRAGVPVGRWLSQTILSAAATELKGAARADTGPEMAPTDAWTANGNAAGGYDAYRQPPGGGAMGGAPPRAAPPGAAPPPALTPEAVLESIQRLTNRIEQADQRTAETIKPLAERVDRLSEQIEEVRTSSGVSSAPVERAMMRMAERLDQLEGGHKPRRARSRPIDDEVEARPSQTSQDGGGLLHRLFGRD